MGEYFSTVGEYFSTVDTDPILYITMEIFYNILLWTNILNTYIIVVWPDWGLTLSYLIEGSEGHHKDGDQKVGEGWKTLIVDWENFYIYWQALQQ